MRVFIGAWCDGEPDWTHVDEIMPWPDAHAFMVERYEKWLTDDCPSCVANAASQLPALRALTPGAEWEGEVEGEEYLILNAEIRRQPEG